MRSAIIFYSLEGNTRTAANQLAKTLGADLFEIRTVKEYPKKGLGKFLIGGRDSSFGRLPALQPLEVNPADYDVVVLALPMWAGKAAAPINSFIKSHDFGSSKVALMISSASGDAGSCAKDLAAKLGRSVGNMATLSLTNPGRMAPAELTEQVNGFVRTLRGEAGGAF
ncbi:MAG: hypothetical protein J6D34_05485 [Atopobiaceae bacterium]|nr:hypothetical protein [Atopobiaceae bacterium]